MKIATLPLAFILALCPSLAQAQVSIHIDLGLPVAPPLVEIEPGIRVVEGFPEEVFFHDGWYWCRRPDGWYRAHSPRARFDWIDSHRVPRTLMREPMGHYRNWHHEEGQDRHYEQRKPWQGPSGRGYEHTSPGQAPGREGRGAGHDQNGAHQGKGRRPPLPPQYP